MPKELQDEESDDDNDAFAAFEAEVEEDDKNTSCMGRVCSFWPIYVSIAMWLIIGCIFYTQVDEWNLAKAFYYTAQSGEEGVGGTTPLHASWLMNVLVLARRIVGRLWSLERGAGRRCWPCCCTTVAPACLQGWLLSFCCCC